MRDGDILILTSGEVAALLAGREDDVLEAVRLAYEAHGSGDSSLPHSTFLRFPGDERNRIIALPAYVGGEFGVAGLKWVSSFPGNLERGVERASAVLILNSPSTGRAEAIIEAALISARRTAASAALAAGRLLDGRPNVRGGLFGCGPINLEIVRFLRTVCSQVSDFLAYDLSAARAAEFKRRCEETYPGVRVEVAAAPEPLLAECSLISFGTTATKPHLHDLSACAPGTVLLHISLRDLSPEVILSCDNVVDDVDHVCRAQTSVHLAEQLSGGRDFIRCTFADILSGRAPARRDPESIVVFSPFGLGVLDLAVGSLVCGLGLGQNVGTVIPSFLNGSANGGRNEQPA